MLYEISYELSAPKMHCAYATLQRLSAARHDPDVSAFAPRLRIAGRAALCLITLI